MLGRKGLTLSFSFKLFVEDADETAEKVPDADAGEDGEAESPARGKKRKHEGE